MKKTTAKMKRFGWVAVLLVMILSSVFANPAYAQTTTLTTTVPGSVLLKLEIQGEGTVLINGVVCDISKEIDVLKNEDVAISFYPKEGYIIDYIVYNGEKILLDNGGSVVLPCVSDSGSLEVVFQQKATAPTTRDNRKPILYLAVFMFSFIMILIQFSLKDRKVKAYK